MPRKPPAAPRARKSSATPKTLGLLTEQSEDYLERIQNLIEGKGYARVSDIADELRLTPSTVSNMVRRLARQGFIEYENYRGLALTQRGRTVARRIQSRHAILTEFLETLGLAPEVVRRDVEGIEHHVDQSTLQALKSLTGVLRAHPALCEQMRAGRGIAHLPGEGAMTA